MNKHHRPPLREWYENMVIWNFATHLFDRVHIRSDEEMAKTGKPGFRVMSYPM